MFQALNNQVKGIVKTNFIFDQMADILRYYISLSDILFIGNYYVSDTRGPF